MKALGDLINKKASIEPSWGPSFGQRTRRHRNGTSGSQLLAFHKREDYSKQAQILQNSDSRAPSVTERRRTRIPARAVNTGVEPLRESLLLAGPDYDDTYYTALSYEWGEAMIGTLSKDTENLDFGLYRSQGIFIWVDDIGIGERAAYSHATMSTAHSIQAMILGYVEELESPKSTMRCNHPIQRVPLRVSSLPSSDSVSLDKSIRGFENDFLDFLRTPCARLKLKSRTNAACLESIRCRKYQIQGKYK